MQRSSWIIRLCAGNTKFNIDGYLQKSEALRDNVLGLVDEIPKVQAKSLKGQEAELIRFYNSRISDFYKTFEEEYNKKTRE